MPSRSYLAGMTWRQLCKKTWKETLEDHLLDHSAELAFWFLLGFFPLLLFVTALLTLTTGTEPGARGSLLKYVSSILPSSASGLVRNILTQTTNLGGTSYTVTLLFALWSASSGMAGVITGLNAVYDLDEERSWWKARSVALVLTVGLGIMGFSAVVIVLYGGAIVQHVTGGGAWLVFWNFVQWPSALGLVLLSFVLMYRYAPNVEQQKWKWLLPGSIIAVGLWLAASFGFKLYLRHFDTFGMTYGSLGALIILMLWFYLTGISILVGGEINAEIEQEAANQGSTDARRKGERKPGDGNKKPRSGFHAEGS